MTLPQRRPGPSHRPGTPIGRRGALALGATGIVSAALPTAAAAASGGGAAWSSSLRSLLSGPGQDAFDATGDGEYFGVSEADYAAVLTGLAGAAIRGLTTEELTGTYGTNDRWSHDFPTALPPVIGTVPAGATVIGFALRANPDFATSVAVLLGPVHLGTYVREGGIGAVPAGTAVSHLLRRGGAPAPGLRLLAQVGAAYTLNSVSRTAGEGLHYAVSASMDVVGPDWYGFGSELPVFQALLHVP